MQKEKGLLHPERDKNWLIPIADLAKRAHLFIFGEEHDKWLATAGRLSKSLVAGQGLDVVPLLAEAIV